MPESTVELVRTLSTTSQCGVAVESRVEHEGKIMSAGCARINALLELSILGELPVTAARL